MNNWVMVLYVITTLNHHGYRDPSDDNYGRAITTYRTLSECEAALQKDPPEYGTDAQCTPFRANMGPISILYFCRGCGEEQKAEAMKGVGGRVQVMRDDWQCEECTPSQRRAALAGVGKPTKP
jgi:hypothetical protein